MVCTDNTTLSQMPGYTEVHCIDYADMLTLVMGQGLSCSRKLASEFLTAVGTPLQPVVCPPKPHASAVRVCTASSGDA